VIERCKAAYRGEHQYARMERERRFLLDRFPADVEVLRVRRLTDRYIEGTTLRLREQDNEDGAVTYKLTQKVRGYITTIYLTEGEFRIFAQLPSKLLRKTRYSVPPFGIDVFEGELQGLILAEAEFDSADEAEALVVPAWVVREVTGEERFTGGSLAEHGAPL
jgi:CYTH domain-containing protein